MLTRRHFLRVSQLQVGEDGVDATFRHRDAVDVVVRESCGRVVTASFRAGLMLVGPTGGGKSRNLHVLEDTLGQLKVLGEQGIAYEKVKIYQLNPKSITMGPRRSVEVDLELEVTVSTQARCTASSTPIQENGRTAS